jgi:hypothetical protein
MRIAFALLTSIVTMALALPATAQGFRGCPPGLAMKHNGCLPPGQAKKMRGYGRPSVVYQPPVAYAPAYPDYRQYRSYPSSGYSYPPSGGSLNVDLSMPLPY